MKPLNDLYKEVTTCFANQGCCARRCCMEKEMFESELEDLEQSYGDALDEVQERIDGLTSTMLVFMEKFVSLHKEREELQDKLENLMVKLAKRKECGECCYA